MMSVLISPVGLVRYLTNLELLFVYDQFSAILLTVTFCDFVRCKDSQIMPVWSI
jgi:hypothetical protein